MPPFVAGYIAGVLTVIGLVGFGLLFGAIASRMAHDRRPADRPLDFTLRR